MEDTKQQVQEQTEKVTTPEHKPTEQTGAPYKVYTSEDEFKKEVQSLSSKAKFEMLKEVGVKNLEEIRVKFAELEASKAEISEFMKMKEQLESVKAEKEKMAEDLLVTKFKIKDEVRNEAMTLAKAKMPEFDNSLEKAMSEIIKKFPTLVATGEQSTPAIPTKIGVAKQPSTVNLSDAERDRLVKRYPHLKNRI
jgi:hypothetical protein